MRRMGEIMNPRDERNWMIPREGTTRRRIYDALLAGMPSHQIREELKLTRSALNNHRHFIVSWAKANASSYAAKHS